MRFVCCKYSVKVRKHLHGMHNPGLGETAEKAEPYRQQILDLLGFLQGESRPSP
jgi:hypothetical protein